MNANYFSKQWELDVDLDVASEKSTTRQDTVYLLELGAARHFSREMFATLSYQYAKDNFVDIHSAFFRFTYRFGNREVAPIRDGAPPAGRL